METLKLAGKKIRAIRFGIVPAIMFLLITVRTLTAGNAVMLTGLCVAFLPFFAQARTITCADEQYTETQEIFSSYLVYLFFITVGMLYLKGLTLVAVEYVSAYEPSTIQRDLFLLTYVCDVSFVSILVPFTCALSSTQRLTLGVLLCNLEIGFMVFAEKVLRLLGDSFMLHDQWGIYFIAVAIVLVSFGVVGVNQKGVTE